MVRKNCNLSTYYWRKRLKENREARVLGFCRLDLGLRLESKLPPNECLKRP